MIETLKTLKIIQLREREFGGETKRRIMEKGRKEVHIRCDMLWVARSVTRFGHVTDEQEEDECWEVRQVEGALQAIHNIDAYFEACLALVFLVVSLRSQLGFLWVIYKMRKYKLTFVIFYKYKI